MNNNNDVILLELTRELKQDKIVDSLVFNRKVNSVILSLNHAYNGKTVVCPINNLQWTRSVENFTKQLTRKGVTKQHILDLCDTLDSKYEKILDFEGVG